MHRRKCDGLEECGQEVEPRLDDPNAPTVLPMKDLYKPVNPQNFIIMQDEELYKVDMCMYLGRDFAHVKHDIT